MKDNIPRSIKMKKVLFICIENSCRSQTAEAAARIHGIRSTVEEKVKEFVRKLKQN
jgi:protein-tyrosine-phosphatase